MKKSIRIGEPGQLTQLNVKRELNAHMPHLNLLLLGGHFELVEALVKGCFTR